jgi:hypothetical protein
MFIAIGLVALSFEKGFTARGINYAEKKFYEIDTWANFIKLFTGERYIFCNKLECLHLQAFPA